MDQIKLKAICQIARTYNAKGSSTENMKGWRERIRISQEKGLDHLHDNPHCSLDIFVSNITAIIFNQCYTCMHISAADWRSLHTELHPLIAKSLGVKK